MKFDLERFTNLYKSQLPLRVIMVQIIQGFWQSRVIYLIAKLGIPALLKDKPKSSGELARSPVCIPFVVPPAESSGQYGQRCQDHTEV